MAYINGREILFSPIITASDNLGELNKIKKSILTMGGSVEESASFEDIPSAIETIPVGDNSYTLVEDSGTAYQKAILWGATKCAAIDKIGGMSYRKLLPEGNLFPYPYTDYYYTDDNNGAVTISSDIDEADSWQILTEVVKLPAGTYILDVGENNLNDYISLYYYSKFVTEEPLSYGKIRIIATKEWNFEGIVVWLNAYDVKTLYPMLYPEDKPITWKPRAYELQHSKVTALNSKGASGALDTFTIPEAVQALEGYGLGINSSYHNTIEYRKSGVVFVQWVKSAVIADVFKPYNTYDNIQYYAFHKPADFVGYSSTSEDFVIAGYEHLYHSDWESTEFIGIATGRASWDDIWVGFPIGTTLEEAKAALEGKEWLYALNEYIETDISDLIPSDNYIKIEGGGSIVFENEHGQAVPSVISYVREVG